MGLGEPAQVWCVRADERFHDPGGFFGAWPVRIGGGVEGRGRIAAVEQPSIAGLDGDAAVTACMSGQRDKPQIVGDGDAFKLKPRVASVVVNHPLWQV